MPLVKLLRNRPANLAGLFFIQKAVPLVLSLDGNPHLYIVYRFAVDLF